MAVQTTCPHCEASYPLPDEKKGQKVKCKKCQEAFTVGANGKKNGQVSNGAAKISVSCPHCKDKTEKPRAFIGEKVVCKKCKKSFTVAADAVSDKITTKPAKKML